MPSTETWHYFAFGLSIESEIKLPELRLAAAPTDVSIRPGRIDPWPELDASTRNGFWLDGDQACHRMERAGAFLVKDGREIVVDAENGADPNLVRMSLLGPSMGLLLLQRGHLVLHGSAVDIGGRAVAFLGPNVSGKSTLAAKFRARGASLITDDVLLIRQTSVGPAAVPSYGQIKLWPDTVQALFDTPPPTQPLHPNFDKRGLPVQNDMPTEPVRLERLFVLSRREELAVTHKHGVEAFRAVMPFWYGVRFGLGLLERADLIAQLDHWSSLLARVQVRGLERPRDLGALDRTIEMINADLG